MLTAGRHNHNITIRNIVNIAINDGLACPLFKPEKLVHLVDLFADSFRRQKTHQHQLAELGRVQHLAKIFIG